MKVVENQEPPASEAQPEIKEPEQIGDFTIGNFDATLPQLVTLGKTLGKGTFGKVKLGTHTLTKEKVAIKILDKQMIKDSSDLERVNREISILKKLRHPHVVQLFDIIENEHFLFLIMEYCSGDQLFKQIRKAKFLKEEEACKFYQQILSGVEYIHKNGIVHRDLKPENILLDHNNDVKLVDFGLGNLYKEGQLLKTACGSPCYAAPEMIKGLKYFGLMTDIWSSGVVLFAMVAGYLPFEDKNTSKLYAKIQNTEYQMPQYLSDHLKDLIKNILVVDPTKRYTIDLIRRHPWYMKVQPAEKAGLILGRQEVTLDDKILNKVVAEYNFNTEKLIMDLKRNKFNSATTAYYLLLKRQERTNNYKKQLLMDINRKRTSVNVQMVLEQQQQQPAQQPTSSAQKKEEQKQQPPPDGTALLEVQSKRRTDHSTDVRGQMQFSNQIAQTKTGNTNYLSTLHAPPETVLTHQQNQIQLQQQPQFIVKAQNAIDPFAKINPKARKLVESVERRQSQERKNDSTGGSGEYADFVNSSNATSAQNGSNHQNARNYNTSNIHNNKQQMQSQATRDGTDQESASSRLQYSQHTNNRQSPIGGGGVGIQNKNQTQLAFYNPNTAGRQQMPTPSYQNYLFTEKTTPSHYRSPVIAQVFSPSEAEKQAAAAEMYVKSSTIKYNTNLKPSTKQPSQIITALMHSTTSQRKYRSTSRANEQSQPTPKNIPTNANKKYGKAGMITATNFNKAKIGGAGQGMGNIDYINHSFQGPASNIGTNRPNDSIDIDMYISPKAFGGTMSSFHKPSNPTTTAQFVNSVRGTGGGGPLAANAMNLSFQIGQPNNQTIIVRNQNTHAKHNSYTGPPTQTNHGYLNIQNMVSAAMASGNGVGYQRFLTNGGYDQNGLNRSSITQEEIAALYSNVVNTQNIIKGKRAAAGYGVNKQKLGQSLNQTFY